MADSKTYLNVPYAQKDEAKGLGARWDAANKKWYVPGNKDISIFEKWQIVSTLPSSPSPPSETDPQTLSANNRASATNGSRGVFTYPTIKDFVAYDGDQPPWD